MKIGHHPHSTYNRLQAACTARLAYCVAVLQLLPVLRHCLRHHSHHRIFLLLFSRVYSTPLRLTNVSCMYRRTLQVAYPRQAAWGVLWLFVAFRLSLNEA